MHKGDKILIILGSVFITIGAIFILVSITTFLIANHQVKNIKVNATVTHVEQHKDKNKLSIEYEINNQVKKDTMYDDSKEKEVGDWITVTYREGETERKIVGIITLYSSLLGMIFFLIGGRELLVILKRKKEIEELIQEGEEIKADFIKVIKNVNVTVSSNSYFGNPYNIYCSWIDPDSKKEIQLKSDNLWEDPEPIIKEHNISTFKVFMDSNNKKKYYIDTRPIEELYEKEM